MERKQFLARLIDYERLIGGLAVISVGIQRIDARIVKENKIIVLTANNSFRLLELLGNSNLKIKKEESKP
jgi:hypothetical protein